ncbi:NAD-dependent succinate-semialdehyde dehydrogenase [Nocardioides sp. NPDC006303]|uniref:NAD-dependent succinate-semialdehyde dehydrogenase n=1 Tax=Nocardioides sp. NPDC006303 TaxID=3156747 RepID=UPI0033BB0DD2
MASQFVLTNPANNKVEATYDAVPVDGLKALIQTAHKTYREWRGTDLSARVDVLRGVARLMEDRKDELAATISREMGKRHVDAKGELDVCIAILEYYADHAVALLADVPVPSLDGSRAYVRKTATGALLGIMPWNYPYYQVVRFAAPNVVAGNVVLVKHASQCPESALELEKLFVDAGAPAGVYTNLFVTHDQLESVIADPRIAGVSLTGSERAGSAVAALAGKHLTKVVLELGGSDPYLIVSTDDMDATVVHTTKARMSNGGQSCNAGKRFIVLDELYDEFVAKSKAAFEAHNPGDPFDEASTFGPMSSESAAVELHEQVKDAIAHGAKAIVGGGRPGGDGAYFEATILVDVPREARAYSEELFGPVSVIHRVSDVEEAIRVANESPFGLGAAVFHTDVAEAEAIASRIDAGMVFINQREGGGPEMPFGGTKRSGFGRELGPSGIEEFLNHKLIYVPAGS